MGFKQSRRNDYLCWSFASPGADRHTRRRPFYLPRRRRTQSKSCAETQSVRLGTRPFVDSEATSKETFGSDGQPGTYFDIDETDCIVLVGHNMASTDTVLWMRILDRRRGPNPPKLIVIDPRRTATAKEADIHLSPRVGTNVALQNGILHVIVERGWIDGEFIEAHTTGFESLRKVLKGYPPERAAEISGVPVEQIEAAAEAVGEAKRLVSTCLQGVYQSNQATAAAVQVNNINLLRGMIGRPGCGVLQMNGQPTAQNT